MIGSVWYVFVTFLVAGYVILDGFDLGAGILHLFVAKTEDEKRRIVRCIGPVWDGNEVWLLAAGGSILLGFPVLLATAFSGFYLPLIMVVWLLAFRALGIELQHHMHHPLWIKFWGAAFGVASLVLAVFFGAALGNVVRGVAMQPGGRFFAPLWTNFQVDPNPGILDWYTISVALTAVAALTVHGGTWVLWRTGGELAVRVKKVVEGVWFVVLVLSLTIAAMTLYVQPQMRVNLTTHLLWWLAPALALAGLVGVRVFVRRDRPSRAFLASSVYLAGMLLSAAAAIFPYVLPARNPSLGLTIQEAVGPEYGLQVGLMWWIPGMLIALGYMVFMYKNFERLTDE